MTFWIAFACAFLRNAALVLVMLGAGELIRRYRSGEPLPLFGDE